MATSMTRSRGRGRAGRSRNQRLSGRRTISSYDRRRIFYDREGRPFRRAYLRNTTRKSAPKRKAPARRRRSMRAMPGRDADGRFLKRRVRTPTRRRARPQRVREQPVRRVRNLPTTSIVREASRRSVAGPALVKRRWWRVDGPVDPSLPEGYAYER